MISTSAGDLYRPGTYEGEEAYPGIGHTDATRGHPGYQAWGRKGIIVPKILLDEGTVIWGPECWWQEITEVPRG